MYEPIKTIVMYQPIKTIDRKEIINLIGVIKKGLSPEFRAFEDDEEPGIQLTIGYNPESGEYEYQTGDNSFDGGAYFYSDWAVSAVYEDTNSPELADELIGQLEELYWSNMDFYL